MLCYPIAYVRANMARSWGRRAVLRCAADAAMLLLRAVLPAPGALQDRRCIHRYTAVPSFSQVLGNRHLLN